MPLDAPANGPDWSVSTPSVIVSSVTPGPVSSAPVPASPAGPVAASSSLVEHAALAATTVAVAHTSARRRTDGLDMVSPPQEIGG